MYNKTAKRRRAASTVSEASHLSLPYPSPLISLHCGMCTPTGTLIADIKKEILAERFKGRNMKLVLLADKRELPDDSASVADAALFGKKIACIATALA